jgi:isopentenyldiphosphate isomerase
MRAEVMRAILLLDGEPTFRRYPFRPALDRPLARAVDDAAQLIERTSAYFDGPIAFSHGISREGAILRRAGRYAEALVVFEEPSLAYRLGFALGVQLFVERREGAVLFQRRAASIGRDPLLWTASASGGLRPDQEPRAAILADAAEEIGLSEKDLAGLRAIAVCANDDTGSTLVVYHAMLADGAEPTPDRERVEQLYWGLTPANVGGQVSSDTLACWEALQRRRERDAAVPSEG